MAAERQATVSMQYGGSSVDTWVLSSQPTSTFTLLPSPMQPADLARKHRTVSSRAAENLFWAGRYGERAENNVRLLRLILGSLEGNDADAMFPTLVELAMQCGLVQSGDLFSPHSPQAFERALVANLSESTGAASIGQNLNCQARSNGEVRGRLSNDHWRTILAARNDFRDALQTLMPVRGAMAWLAMAMAVVHRRAARMATAALSARTLRPLRPRDADERARTPVGAIVGDQRRARRPHDTRRSVAAAVRRAAHRTRVGR